VPGGEGVKHAVTVRQDVGLVLSTAPPCVARTWRVNSSAGECGAKDQVSRACPSSGVADAGAGPGRTACWQGGRAGAMSKGAGVNAVPMEIVVLARHLEVPDTLKQTATKKTERLSRYLAGMERAEVCFSKTPLGRLGKPITCEIVLEGHRHIVRAVGAGGTPASAFDAAVDKAGLQLTRLKRKLVGRSRPRHGTAGRVVAGTTGLDAVIELDGDELDGDELDGDDELDLFDDGISEL
jgi:ribosomal subunit interface protein